MGRIDVLVLWCFCCSLQPFAHTIIPGSFLCWHRLIFYMSGKEKDSSNNPVRTSDEFHRCYSLVPDRGKDYEKITARYKDDMMWIGRVNRGFPPPGLMQP
ncbi:hypothetical protein BDV25DRAFT_61242 [Aspergillus avenaceus]|uniref:Uncharacterized protein n=1 Tax=Aspergillus avenaceus TaxID=36643 RepID=A0A5N6THL6_ASPAV|nr:hypothetical protein BDV25DRAFT_61242 [Aspergillus avenaceus]